MEKAETATMGRPRNFCFSPEQIDSAKEKLKPNYLAILYAASTLSSYSEMAAQLNLASVGTVKSRLNRARRALMDTLRHPNGKPMFTDDGIALDENGMLSP